MEQSEQPDRAQTIEQMISLKGELLELEKKRKQLKQSISYCETMIFGAPSRKPVGRPKKEKSEDDEEPKPKRKVGRPKKVKVKENTEE